MNVNLKTTEIDHNLVCDCFIRLTLYEYRHSYNCLCQVKKDQVICMKYSLDKRQENHKSYETK